MAKLSITQAILIGSVIISVGIYLGLSQKTPNGSTNLAHSQSLPQTTSQPQAATPDQGQLTQLLSEPLTLATPDLLKACPAQ